MWQVFSAKWLPKFRAGYEIRIRITIGFLFLLIVVANLNSLRYFRQIQFQQIEQVKHQAAENLALAAGFLRSNPVERLRSAHFQDFVHAAGFDAVQVVETDLLTTDRAGSSQFAGGLVLDRLREVHSGDQEIAGVVGATPPTTISAPYRAAGGGTIRSVYYHFVSDNGEPLTLVATLSAETEVALGRFSILNAMFQLVSIVAALAITVVLLKIMLKPYRQIKSHALSAEIAGTDHPESVDFAVETFQKVIDELKQKEQKLQRLYAQQRDKATSLEEYNEYILASMPSGVISCDTAGMITRFNEAATAIFRRDASAAMGRHYTEIFSQYEMVLKMINSALLHSSETSLVETEMEIAGHGRLWLSLDCSLLRDSRYATRGAMLLISDLTGIKKLEAEIAMKDQMAALGELSAGLAHQLRNSLAAIIGFAQLLKKLLCGDGQPPDIVVSILKEAQATEQMLTRFLTLSRPEAFAPEPTKFSEILNIVETHFAEKARQSSVRIRFNLQTDLPRLVCDPLLIANALINLIQNSLEALTPGGQVTVAVSYLAGEQSFCIAVTDNGKGMPSDELEKIFTPFYTSGKASGTGLGLSLAKKWIITHHGDIHCDSSLGRGTTFTITLPREPLQEPGMQPENKNALAKT